MSRNLSLLLIPLFILSWFTSFSQEKKSAENQLIGPKGDTIVIQPILLADITTKAEEAYDKLKKIEGRLEPPKELVKFDSIYEIGLKGIYDEKKRLEGEDVYYSLRTIDDFLREWNRYNETVSNWKVKVNDRIRTLENDLFDTEVLKAIWSLTLKNARDGGVPANVLTSVSDLNKKVAKVQGEVKAKQTEALRKQNNLTEISLVIDDVLSVLDKTRKQMQSDYFRQDSPAIWQSADSTARLSNVKSILIQSLNENARSIGSFYDLNKGTFILHLIIFLVLWLLYYLLHKQAMKMKVEMDADMIELNKAKTVISHYGTSALIVSLFLTIWLYPTITTAVSDLLQLFYIIIAIYYLPKYIDIRLRKLLIVILILFFVNEVQLFFYGRVFFARLVLFVENILVFWIFYEIIGPDKFISKELRKQHWTILVKLVPLFFIFIAASFVGNIIGFVDLALLLGNTVVNSIFNLIILLLAIMVINRTISILLRTPFIQSSNIFKNHLSIIETRLTQTVQFMGVLLWLRAVLRLLGLLDGLSEWFNEAIQTSWEIGQHSTIVVGNIINFILVILGTVVLYRLINVILKEDVFPRIKLPRGVPGTITTIISYLIVGYGIFISIGAAGVDLGTFGLIAGALGVGIGFGLQGIVANFIAGLVLAFERPIQVGDEIQLTSGMGIVLNIGVRSTTIRTYNGSEIIIPNSDLITKDVTNWTLSDRKKRRDINVNVAYGSNPHEVMELIKRVANEHPDVLKVPAPWALFDGFGDSSLNFRIRIWTTMDTGMTVQSAVAIKIYDALGEAGIEIPFPQRDLHLRSADPSLNLGSPQNTQPPPAKQRRTKKKDTESENKEEIK